MTENTGPTGFLLLTLPEAELTTPGTLEPTRGPLSVECVTLATPVDDRDVWLVLRVGPSEFPISPTQIVRYDRNERRYVFIDHYGAGDRDWVLRLSEPQSSSDAEDQETLEVILSQYAALEQSGEKLRPVGPPSLPPRRSISSVSGPPTYAEATGEDMRGRLVLVDEDSGAVVGSLAPNISVQEDANVHAPGHEKDPVIVDLPEIDPSRPTQSQIHVHAVPWEETDTLMRTASLISRGIVLATDAITSGIDAATSLYKSHTTPSPSPLEFSESTQGHFRRVHRISGKAVEVTAKTTGLINSAIERAVGYVSGSASKPRSRPSSPAPNRVPVAPPTQAPTLPPRKNGSGLLAPTLNQMEVSASQTGPPPLPPRPPLKNRLLLSTDLLLTTIENSAVRLVDHGSTKFAEAVGHKYGRNAGEMSGLAASAVKNVGVVYIDVRGVGRRALLRKAGKSYIKAKLGNRDVVLGVDEEGRVASAKSQ